MTAGLSALLAWLPLLLTGESDFGRGVRALLIYLFAGALLSCLGHVLLPSELPRMLGAGAVAVCAGLVLRFGVFWYLTAYVLLFWYVLSPLFSASLGLSETLEGHLVGTVGLLAYWSFSCLRSRDLGANHSTEARDDAVPWRLVWRYSMVLSATTMVGTGLGGRILSADPTLMTQASLNIIAPSVDMTLQSGLLRAVFGIGGLAIGFYLGLLFPNFVFYQVIIAICAFVALGFFQVNIGFLTGAFAVMFAFPIGMPGGEAAHAVGNERLLAELLGIGFACLAIFALGRKADPEPSS
ncbi:MAG: hypothetical protein GJ676_02205 [Rhodobacteraceae bacterium]|nr:hypothetical protein [Paracoccaceae bacterium]